MMDLTTEVARFIRDFGVFDPGPIDESSPDLDPTDEPPAARTIRTVRYSDRFGEQVRTLGGVEAEAALIICLGSHVEGE